jgi:membrane-bound lytic murein transglycosylase D
MKKNCLIILCSFCSFLTANAQIEAQTAAQTSAPIEESFPDEIGLIPESLDANVDSLLHSWHVQYFSKTESYCHDEDENVYFDDETIRDRLSRLPHTMPMDYNKLVRNSIDFYTNRRRSLIRYMLGMADYYFPIIEPILEENGLPLELKYLVVVESALNPTAVSRVGAGGMWQFMLQTGKSYGLEINSLVDERRDPVKATQAACRYFKDMYNIYGDWNLVVASYNCGPGGVNKAIRRSGGKTNFWQIYQQLPRETRSYVPLFIAACYVMNYYCDHNICPVQTSLPLATDTLMITRQLSMHQVAEMLQLDIEQLRALNPQYRRDIIPGNIKPTVLKLPAVATYSFVDKEDSLYRSLPVATSSSLRVNSREQITHVVQSGESVITIADKYGVTAKDLRKWNGLGTSNRVAVGKRLRLNVDNGGIMHASPSSPTLAQSSSSEKGYVTYQVQSGDSLFSISKKYPGLTVATLQQINNLSGTNIRPGQILKIPLG